MNNFKIEIFLWLTTFKNTYYNYLFIIFFCRANGFAQKSKRKTLTANDVVEAMKDLEFDEFLEPLQRALQCKLRQKLRKLCAGKI